MNKSHKTAITRNTVSRPMRYLAGKALIQGEALDYGCGKGFDADACGMKKYDPYFAPECPVDQFDTITCNYVFNVIDSPFEREILLERLQELLKPGGKAYITVRRDIKNEGYTKRNTYQENIVLNLKTVHKTSSFEIYELTK